MIKLPFSLAQNPNNLSASLKDYSGVSQAASPTEVLLYAIYEQLKEMNEKLSVLVENSSIELDNEEELESLVKTAIEKGEKSRKKPPKALAVKPVTPTESVPEGEGV